METLAIVFIVGGLLTIGVWILADPTQGDDEEKAKAPIEVAQLPEEKLTPGELHPVSAKLETYATETGQLSFRLLFENRSSSAINVLGTFWETEGFQDYGKETESPNTILPGNAISKLSGPSWPSSRTVGAVLVKVGYETKSHKKLVATFRFLWAAKQQAGGGIAPSHSTIEEKELNFEHAAGKGTVDQFDQEQGTIYFVAPKNDPAGNPNTIRMGNARRQFVYNALTGIAEFKSLTADGKQLVVTKNVPPKSKAIYIFSLRWSSTTADLHIE